MYNPGQSAHWLVLPFLTRTVSLGIITLHHSRATLGLSMINSSCLRLGNTRILGDPTVHASLDANSVTVPMVLSCFCLFVCLVVVVIFLTPDQCYHCFPLKAAKHRGDHSDVFTMAYSASSIKAHGLYATSFLHLPLCF